MLSGAVVSDPGERGGAADAGRWSQRAAVEDVPLIRAFVEDACGRLSASADVAFRLALAGEEICTNVIQHGYDGSPGQLDLWIRATGGAVSLTVRDQAPPFDPTAAARGPISEPAEERDPGGLGLHLVHQLVDDVAHRGHRSGNEVVLTINDRKGE